LAAGVEGKWHFVFSTDQGDYPFDFTITGDGDNVVCKAGESELKGAFKGGALELTGDFYVADAGYSAPMTIKGTLADGKLSGNATWDVYETTFTATKAE
jgi:hypothetical protein